MYALVVDDSAAMRHHLSRTLQGLGWEVGTAVNGANALQVLGSLGRCDLILTDWHMPDMDGMQLCREIRKTGRHNGVRIVMVTSDAVMGSVDQALQAGANDIIMKPFTKESLQERLSTVMGVDMGAPATAPTSISNGGSTTTLHWNMLQQFMMRQTGNVLRDDQAYLMESRLQRSAKSLGFASVADLINAACVPLSPAKLSSAIVEALTTHETSFFRDVAFWRTMQNEVLAKLVDKARSGQRVKIWCAACSTGQETYSLLIMLREMASTQLSQFEIIATDIAEPTLEHARTGFYSSLEVNRGLDIKRLSANFTQATGGFRVKDELLRNVTWRIHNLLGTNAEPMNCDLVLCRNVLIYFNETDRTAVIKRLIKSTNVGGHLALGSTESTREPELTAVSSGLYLKSR